MEVATVPLALDDFVPVVLAGVGALLLARFCGRQVSQVARLAMFGALAILTGGLLKAGWKLNLALTGDDVAGVDDLLFALLAPGFTLLAWGLLALRGRLLPAWQPIALSGAAVATSLALSSTGPLLALTVVTSTATGVLAIVLARQRGDDVAAGLFCVQLALAYALVPFAGAGQSIAHQWWEQSLNTLGQGAFALGSFRFVKVRSYA